MATRRIRPASATVSRSTGKQQPQSQQPTSTHSTPAHQHPTIISMPSYSASRPRSDDSEALLHTVHTLKDSLQASEKENILLKTQMQKLIAQMRKKEKQIDVIVDMKLASDPGDASSTAIVFSQLRDLRSELVTISRMSEALRESELELHRKAEECARMKRSLKYTREKELEVERATYFDQLKRTRKALIATQTQLAAAQAQIAHPRAKSRPSSAHPSPSHHPHAAAPAVISSVSTSTLNSHHLSAPVTSAYDQQIMNALRAEVAHLRAENARLASGGSSSSSCSNSVRLTNVTTSMNVLSPMLYSKQPNEASVQEEKVQEHQEQQEENEYQQEEEQFVTHQQEDLPQEIPYDASTDVYQHPKSTESDTQYQQYTAAEPYYDAQQQQQQQQSYEPAAVDLVDTSQQQYSEQQDQSYDSAPYQQQDAYADQTYEQSPPAATEENIIEEAKSSNEPEQQQGWQHES